MELLLKIKAYLHEAGLAGYLTIGSAFFLVIIAIERYSLLFGKLKPLSPESFNEIQKKILSKDYSGALQLCNSNQNIPQLDVIKSALIAVDSGREAIKNSLGATIVRITKRCEKRVSLIALIASVATLLGLLGTITGLITTFAAIANADPAEKATKLGLGISEAMNSTALGLIVGVIAMVIHTLLTNRIDEIIGLAQETGFNVATAIEQSERGE